MHLATHGAEVPYAFDNLKQLRWSWDAVDSQIAHQMSGYYANFAKTGDPNGPGLPPWPIYDPARPQRIVFDEHGAAAADLPLAKFRLIDRSLDSGPLCALNR
jgi:para-nitrobenzyl esterase